MSRIPVMTTDEIRYWLNELHETHGWGWGCLARTLRLGETKHVVSKARRPHVWFVGGEQRRCSKQIDRILSGELVPVMHGRRQDAVVAARPVPIQQPRRLVYSLSTGRMSWVAPRPAPVPTLPAFAEGLRRLLDGRHA
jgi:hypothetical protein